MRNLLLILLIFPLLVSGQIQRQSSMDAALPSGWQSWQGGAAPTKSYTPFALIEGSETWSHEIQSVIVRSGSAAWKMEFRIGDRNAYFGSERSEITVYPKGSQITSAQPTAGRMSTYIPNTSGVNSTWNQEYIFPVQYHPWATGYDGGSPSFSIEILNGKFRAVVRHTGTNTSTGANETMLTFDLGFVEYNTFVDWLWYYYPSKNTDGRLVIWRKVVGVDNDYVKTSVDYTGRTLHGWSQWPFPKMGIYCWNMPSSGTTPTKRVGYIDMVAFGQATEATVLDLFRLDGPPPPPPNQPPTANAGANQTLGAVSAASLAGTRSDADGTISLESWARVSGPNTPTFTCQNCQVTGVNGLVAGTYVFSYTVTDNNGATASSTVSVSVATANTAPTVDAGPNQNLTIGDSDAALDGEATDAQDPDCCTIHGWTKVAGPGTVTFSPNAGDWNPTVSNLASGSTYTFRLTVTDSHGTTSFDDVSITTAATNQKPIVTPVAPIIVVRSTTSESGVSVTATDPEGGALTYSWIQKSGPNTSIITGGTTHSPMINGLTIGSYLYECTVTDVNAGVTKAQVSLRVNRPPDVEVDTTLAFSFAKGITAIPINGDGTDADGTITQYRWRLVAGVGEFADSTSQTTTFTAAGPGEYTLQLVATDNDGEESSGTYQFIIQAGYLIQKHGLRKALPTP